MYGAPQTGSKDPYIRALEPKHYNIIGVWALQPHYLGPWTLRVLHSMYKRVNVYSTATGEKHGQWLYGGLIEELLAAMYMSYSLNSQYPANKTYNTLI